MGIKHLARTTLDGNNFCVSIRLLLRDDKPPYPHHFLQNGFTIESRLVVDLDGSQQLTTTWTTKPSWLESWEALCMAWRPSPSTLVRICSMNGPLLLSGEEERGFESHWTIDNYGIVLNCCFFFKRHKRPIGGLCFWQKAVFQVCGASRLAQVSLARTGLCRHPADLSPVTIFSEKENPSSPFNSTLHPRYPFTLMTPTEPALLVILFSRITLA